MDKIPLSTTKIYYYLFRIKVIITFVYTFYASLGDQLLLNCDSAPSWMAYT